MPSELYNNVINQKPFKAQENQAIISPKLLIQIKTVI